MEELYLGTWVGKAILSGEKKVMRTSATAVRKQYLLLGTLSICIVPYNVSVKTSRRCVSYPP